MCPKLIVFSFPLSLGPTTNHFNRFQLSSPLSRSSHLFAIILANLHSCTHLNNFSAPLSFHTFVFLTTTRTTPKHCDSTNCRTCSPPPCCFSRHRNRSTSPIHDRVTLCDFCSLTTPLTSARAVRVHYACKIELKRKKKTQV